MLTTIKSSLDSLTSSAETKKANKESLLSKFQEELSSEVASLKENILNITQEIESPALLDPESAYEEIKQTLERLEKSLEQVKQKAAQYEAYEEKFEFLVHEYPEIDDAEFNLYHLNLLWDSLGKHSYISLTPFLLTAFRQVGQLVPRNHQDGLQSAGSVRL